MLCQVMFSDEGPLTEVALQLLGTGVDEHVRCYVGFLCERLLTDGASVVLLTC